MNKQVLISVRPENAVNILNGSKTIELRKVVLKWVLEEVEKGNAVKFLMYVTKNKPHIKVEYYTDENPAYIYKGSKLMEKYHDFANGKVVASFEVSKIDGIAVFKRYNGVGYEHLYFTDSGDYIDKEACVDQYEMDNYFRKYGSKRVNDGDAVGYALHISNLKVFDTPKKLSDYYYFKTKWVYSGMDCPPYVDEVKTVLTKAFKNMGTVYSNENL